MASIKRNHTPSNTKAMCSKCGHIASAPDGKRHRKCKGAAMPAERGVWLKYQG